jgi:hypothetical protein
MLEWSPVKLKRYFLSLWNSFSSPGYYLEVLNAPFLFSLKFFFVSCVLLTILATILFNLFTIPRYQRAVHENLDRVVQNFPADLHIRWDGNQLKITPEEPLFLPYLPFLTQEDLPEHFVIIALRFPAPDAAMTELKTNSLIFVSDQNVYIQSTHHQWAEYPLKEYPGFESEFIINTSTLPGFIDQTKKFLDVIQFVLIALYPFVYLVGILIGRIIGIAINSLMLMYMLKLFNKHFPFSKIFQISLHIVVIAEVAQLIFNHIPEHQDVPVFTLTYWAYIIAIFISLRKVQFIPKKATQ